MAPSKQTVEGFAREWLAAKQGAVNNNTLHVYRVNLKSYVFPTLGPRKIQALKPAELNRLYAQLAKSGGRKRRGLSAKTIRNLHGTIHKMLADAEKRGAVTRNVASLADPPKPAKPKLETWAPDELRSFLTVAETDRLYGLWWLLAMTEMRRSEVYGLRWKSLDLEAAELRVADTVVLVAGQPVFREAVTKSAASARTIALDAQNVAVLKAHRARQLQEKLVPGEVYEDQGFVLCNEIGDLLHHEWVTLQGQRLAAAAGCRGSACTPGCVTGGPTWALQQGVPAKVVQERLGRSSIAITLDLYSHVSAAMDRDAAEAVAQILAEK